MATTNLTAQAENVTGEKFTCSPSLSNGTLIQLTFLSVLNIFMSIAAFLGNTLILVALRKASSLHPPSKLLLRSLATTDLFVGLVSEPMYAIYLMATVSGSWTVCRYALKSVFIVGYILATVSLLTLAAISVDRLLALLLGLRYRQIVTLKRTHAVVISFWVVSTIASTLNFWNSLIPLWYGHIVKALAILTSIYSYTKIFFKLRHHQTLVQDNFQEQRSQATPLNVVRYRKTVSSALWLQLTLVFCYLPYLITTSLRGQSISSSVFFAFEFTTTLVFLNSSLNPILYCWKIRDVRRAVKETVRQLYCSSN